MNTVVSLDNSVVVDWYGCPESMLDDSAVELKRRLPQELHLDEYVIQQFRASVLHACVIAHASLCEHVTLADAERSLGTYRFSGGVRGGGTAGRIAVQVLQSLRSSYESAHSDVNAATIRAWIAADLADYLQGDLMDDLLARVGGRSNHTGCVMADGEVEFRDGRFSVAPPRCQKAQPRACTIEEFWKIRVADLRKLRASTSKREKDVKVQMVAEATKKALSEARGNNCRGPMSDVVIYLSSTDTGVVATTNVVDFEFASANTITRVEILSIPSCGQRAKVDPVGHR